MDRWMHMSQYDIDRMWVFVNTSLRFRPYDCNSIIAPVMKHRVIDITRHHGSHFSPEKYNDLKQQFLSVFRSITSPGEYIYALDWEHDPYVFSPYGQMQTGAGGDWPVLPYVNGHFVFFITSDLRNVYCADGINMHIYLIGDTLIKQFKFYEPQVFR